ncbi:IS1 family transposase [Massilia atriviolacea]|uniref:IS1 family transposase n=1 Tax=Massilia atriviolacea TaxID=2495579 RepID=A0A430HFM5_9BURK|nr:IS1 family transposase [Massilia atriviolacea]RSZ56311.1 IS1 family transposase [Massilia atriviolacea]
MNPYEPPKTNSSPISLPDEDAQPVGCPHCDQVFRATPKKTFLGFQRYSCPACSKKFKYPLSLGYRVAYWLLLIGSFAMIASKPGTQPNLFTLLMAIAVISDLYLIWKRR